MESFDREFLKDMMPCSEAYLEYEEEKKKEALQFYCDQEEAIPPKTPRKSGGKNTAA